MDGLDERPPITNGTQLERFVPRLAESGVRRINVSFDARNPARFRDLTRGGDPQAMLRGTEAAVDEGIEIKINIVALVGGNEAARVLLCIMIKN
ncbi:MAG: radical SAM protein [Pseudomonadota bacterium]